MCLWQTNNENLKTISTECQVFDFRFQHVSFGIRISDFDVGSSLGAERVGFRSWGWEICWPGGLAELAGLLAGLSV